MWALSALICTLMLCRSSGSYYTLCDKDTLMSCWLKKKSRAKIFESAQPILMYQRIYIVFEIVYIFLYIFVSFEKIYRTVWIITRSTFHVRDFSSWKKHSGANKVKITRIQTKVSLLFYIRSKYSFALDTSDNNIWQIVKIAREL